MQTTNNTTQQAVKKTGIHLTLAHSAALRSVRSATRPAVGPTRRTGPGWGPAAPAPRGPAPPAVGAGRRLPPGLAGKTGGGGVDLPWSQLVAAESKRGKYLLASMVAVSAEHDKKEG